MKRSHFLFLITATLVAQPSLFSQTAHWESMDGPYRPETRTHTRLPDGDRRYYGIQTGIHRSTDNGDTWSLLSPIPGLNLTIMQSPTGKLIGHLHKDVEIEGVYQGYDTLYLSSDRGEHWTVLKWSSLPRGASVTIAFGEADTIHQTNWEAGSGAILQRSTDGGATWSNILESSNPYQFMNLYTQPNNVYVGGHSPEGRFRIVQRSTDGGTTWETFAGEKVLFHPPGSLLRMRYDTTVYGETSVRAFLESSTDGGTLWTKALTADSGFTSLITDNVSHLLVLCNPGSKLFSSGNGGLTWDSLGTGPNGDPFISISYYGTKNVIGLTRAHVYYRSTDYGTSWIPILDPSGAPVTGTVEPASDSLFVVADWRGNWIESTDAGATWRSITSPYLKEQINALLQLPSGSLLAGTMTGLATKTAQTHWSSPPLSGGPTWALSYPSGPVFFMGVGYEGKRQASSYPYYFPLVAIARDTSDMNAAEYWWLFESRSSDVYWRCRTICGTTTGILLMGYNSELFSQTIKGHSWEDASWIVVGPPHNGAHEVLSVTPGTWTSIVEDSSHALWAAGDSAGLFRSTDLGTTWSSRDTGGPPINILSMVVGQDGNIFVGTIADGVYRSTDSGTMWTASGLHGKRVQALAVGNGSTVFAGTTDGVFYSSNSGVTWSDITSDLPNRDIHAITVAPEGSVYSGTWGEGVYRLVGAPVPDSASRYFPLAVGNKWAYVSKDIPIPITYVTSILDTTRVAGQLYYLYQGRPLQDIGSVNYSIDTLRLDSLGRVWCLQSAPWLNQGSKEWMFFDFSVDSGGSFQSVTPYPAPNTVYVQQHQTATVPAGTFTDCVDLYFARGGDDREGFVFAPGVGIVRWYGPFLGNYGLEYAVVDGRHISDVRESQNDVPVRFSLEQNFPNPFNPSTVIKYTIGGTRGSGPVLSGVEGLGARKTRLVVYDVLGREVATLVDEAKLPGNYEVKFDGSQIPSGVYFYRLTAGAFDQSRKMLLVK